MVIESASLWTPKTKLGIGCGFIIVAKIVKDLKEFKEVQRGFAGQDDKDIVSKANFDAQIAYLCPSDKIKIELQIAFLKNS